MKPQASPRKMRKVSGDGRVHALHELEQRAAHGVALAPALQAGDDVVAGDRLAVVEFQALAQLEGPQPVVGAFGPALDHLRLDLGVLVGAEQGVVDHVAVVAAHVGGGPDRVQDGQVGVRHDAQCSPCPGLFGTQRMTAEDLARISATRPVVVLHASQHLMNVNRAAMARAGITRDTELEGIPKGADGEPTGELQEFAAMFPIVRMIGNRFRITATSETGLRLFGAIAQWAGVTTATDLANDLSDDNVATMLRVTGEDSYPVRLVPLYAGLGAALPLDQATDRVRRAQAQSTERLHMGRVKIVADGSIQGFTARLKWPGYHNGAPNGIWIQPPEVLRQMIGHFHAEGFQLHVHTNGDEASEFVIDCFAGALARHARSDHRHTLQHCQMAHESQFHRMARLGLCVNLFANHLYYWGDAHAAQTMGPDRAQRMDACGTALRHGVPLAIHSDAPITPMAPLFTAWCAVNRLTSSGQVLGEGERISVDQALYAITMGAAFTLGMDDRIGSIEVGKWADFCVLDSDPTQVAPQALKDVGVAATVLGGQVTERLRAS
jgi:predicted amidohydrolase YtcJ